MNPSLKNIRAEGEALNARFVALRGRQSELHAKAADLRNSLAAASAAVDRAKAGLSAALLAEARGEQVGDAPAKARAALASASTKADKGDHADIEVEALEIAINGIESDLAELGQQQRQLVEAEKQLISGRLEELAADRGLRLRLLAAELATLYAECAALNELNERAGGSPSRFSNGVLAAISLPAVGPGWVDRHLLHFDPKATRDAALGSITAALRAEGFRAV